MSKGRILVVEDSVVQRELIAGLLRDEGYEVVEAEDGQLGLARAALSEPDLVFADIQMPVLDGIEMCRALKATPATAHIPVVFLSTLDSLEDVVRGLEVGAADYLSKGGETEGQILAMAEAQVASRQPDYAGPGRWLDVPKPERVPASWLDGTAMGVLVSDLRRKPLYANAAGRKLIGTGPGARLDGDAFDRFVRQAATRFAAAREFFAPLEWEGRAVSVRLEPSYNEKREICAVLMLIGPPR